jgi:hypothetical protein
VVVAEVPMRALETIGRGGGPEDLMVGAVVLGLAGTLTIWVSAT